MVTDDCRSDQNLSQVNQLNAWDTPRPDGKAHSIWTRGSQHPWHHLHSSHSQCRHPRKTLRTILAGQTVSQHQQQCSTKLESLRPPFLRPPRAPELFDVRPLGCPKITHVRKVVHLESLTYGKTSNTLDSCTLVVFLAASVDSRAKFCCTVISNLLLYC